MARTHAAADFTVGWVCALPIELAAAAEMMDEEYDDLPQPPPPPTDTNIYTFGRIGVHNVVAACLPAGQMGTNQAAIVASQMRNSFPALRFGVLVGIGGGVPTDENDIRLGDVVISQPVGQHGGVVQFDFGKTGPNGRIARTGVLNAPPTIILNALAKLRANDIRDKTRIVEYISKLAHNRKFARPGSREDTLYLASSQHVLGPTCANCSQDEILHRNERFTESPVLFFGNIASGNQVMKDGPTRDRISRDLGGILCFEMEAAGLLNNFPCLVIRGICDYADAHKNKQWQPYAAATAAACAKELLSIIPIVAPAMQHEPEAPRFECHFIVPLGRNADFVGREAIIDHLMEMVPPIANKEDCQRTAIEGLGGVGKTQIALETAYRVRQKYPDCSVFWVPTVTMALFENAYRAIGQALDIPNINDDKADVKGLVKTALEKSSGSWLLILDNADDVDLWLGDHGDVCLSDYLPFSHQGSILFTTRSHEVATQLVPFNQIIILSEMPEADAINMLRKLINNKQMRDGESVRALLDFLAYLPLAIKQASAYIAQTGISTAKYLEHCKSSNNNQIKLLSRDFEDRGRYREIANPIATTWLISFQHITKRYPLATTYLKLICFLSEKDIPTSLLPQGVDEMEQSEALGALKGYAFIIEREDPDSFDMHRLVKLVMINWLELERAYHITETLQNLNRVYPYPQHENRREWMRYMPHAEAALSVGNESTDIEVYASLLWRIGSSQKLLGKYKEAGEMYRKTLELKERMLGPNHPDTLGSMDAMASVLFGQGNSEQAEKMYRKTIELREKVLGAEHPSTLDSRNNLANVFDYQGKHKEAEMMHRETLEVTAKVLGAEHPSTLDTMHNLALALDGQGKHEESESMQRKALELTKRVLGPEHPSTLINMYNLALVIEKQGKHEEANSMYQHTLKLRDKVLGAEHPTTLDTIDKLAWTIDNQGKHEVAELMYRQNVKMRKKVQGAEDISTIGTMISLATVLDKQDKREEAESMYRKTLELMQKVRGAEHIDSINTMERLAFFLYDKKEHEEAESMYREIVEHHERMLGAEHTNTLTSMNSLANVLADREKYEEAESIYRRTLLLTEQVRGQKHQSTLRRMHNLALVLTSQGKHQEAEAMHRKVLKLKEEVLGLEHPSTLKSRRCLAEALEIIDDARDANVIVVSAPSPSADQHFKEPADSIADTPSPRKRRRRA